MPALLLIFALILAGLSGAQTATAQSNDSVAAPAKKPGHGFDWFFAHVKRPDGPCTGEHVVATWYASGSHTASGQPFNPQGHTAAHRTLPFGSRVTVINPRNGQSITVVINDRGPFVKGVTLDLALGAARAIGMTETQWVCMSEARRD